MNNIYLLLKSTRNIIPLRNVEYYHIKSEKDFYDEFSPLVSFLSDYRNVSLHFINTLEAKSELLKIKENYYIIFDFNQSSYIMDIIELFFTAQSDKDIITFIGSYFKHTKTSNKKYERLLARAFEVCEEKRHLHSIVAAEEFHEDLKLIKRILDYFIVFHEFGHLLTIYFTDFPTKSFEILDIANMVDNTFHLFIEHYSMLTNKQPDSPITKHFYAFSKHISGEGCCFSRIQHDLQSFFFLNRHYLIRELGADLISLRMTMELFKSYISKSKEIDFMLFSGLSLIFKAILFYKDLFLISDYFDYRKSNDNNSLDLFRDLLFTNALLLEMSLKLDEDKFLALQDFLNSITISYYNRFGYTINNVKNIAKTII